MTTLAEARAKIASDMAELAAIERQNVTAFVDGVLKLAADFEIILDGNTLVIDLKFKAIVTKKSRAQADGMASANGTGTKTPSVMEGAHLSYNGQDFDSAAALCKAIRLPIDGNSAVRVIRAAIKRGDIVDVLHVKDGVVSDFGTMLPVDDEAEDEDDEADDDEADEAEADEAE